MFYKISSNFGAFFGLNSYLYFFLKMGCLKITYRNNFEYLKVSFRKELSLKNSVEKGYGALELKDHLGNVRAVITDEKILEDSEALGVAGHNEISAGDYFSPNIVTFSDYYPFGMLQRSGQVDDLKYRYGYNGKEKDNEVKGNGNQIDFGARAYDSRLGRFFSLDPKMKDYPSISPYCYAANTPVQAIDDNGEGPIVVIHSAEQSERLKAALQTGDAEEVKRILLYSFFMNPVDDNGKRSDYMKRVIKKNGSYEGKYPKWGTYQNIGTTSDLYTRVYGFNKKGDYIYLGKVYLEPALTDEQKEIQKESESYDLTDLEKIAFNKWKNEHRNYKKSIGVNEDANDLTEKQLWQAYVASLLSKDKFKNSQRLISQKPKPFWASDYTLSEISEGSYFKSVDAVESPNSEGTYSKSTTYGVRSKNGYEKISNKQLQQRGINPVDLPTVSPKSIEGKEKR